MSAVIAAGVITFLAITLLPGLGHSDPDVPMPTDSGGQTKIVKDVDFFSFDEPTDLNELSIVPSQRLEFGNRYIEAQGTARLFAVQGGKQQWVFVWQGRGPDKAIEGVPVNDKHTVPKTIASRPDELVRFTRNPSGFSHNSSYDHLLTTSDWIHVHRFAVITSNTQVYVALVDHPVDEMTAARAREFLDEAIKHPRVMHHAMAITALMRAVGDPNPQWLAWLKAQSQAGPHQLVQESDPEAHEIIASDISNRANDAYFDLTATYALLSEFEDSDFMASVVLPSVQAASLLSNYTGAYAFKTQPDVISERIDQLAKTASRDDLKHLLGAAYLRSVYLSMLSERGNDSSSALAQKWRAAIEWAERRSPDQLTDLLPQMETALVDPNFPRYLHAPTFERLLRIDPARALAVTLTRMENAKELNDVVAIRLHSIEQSISRSWRNPRPAGYPDWESILTQQKDRIKRIVFERGPKWQSMVASSRISRSGRAPHVDTLKNWLQKVGERDFAEFDKRMAEADKWAKAARKSNTGLGDIQIAIEKNDLAAVEAFLKSGVHPDQHKSDRSEINLMTVAIERGNVELLQLLLKYKADPNLINGPTLRERTRPILRAIDRRKLPIIKALIQGGAPLHPQKGSSPLQYAVNQNVPEIVALLLELGANPNVDRGVIMRNLPTKVNREIVRLLIKHGGDASIPMSLAASANRPQMIETLLSLGASPNTSSTTTIQYAIAYDDANLLSKLLQAGAISRVAVRGFRANGQQYPQLFLTDPVLSKDKAGIQNILAVACRWGSPKVVKWTLDQGADPNLIVSRGGVTQIQHALLSRMKTTATVVGLLIKAGAETNPKDAELSTMELARRAALQQQVMDVLEGKAEPDTIIGPLYNTWTLEQKQAFLTSIRDPSDHDTIKALLEKNLDPDAYFDITATRGKALDLAVYHKHEPAIRLLLEHGARADLSYRGKRLYSFFDGRKEPELFNLLSKKYHEHKKKYR